MTTIVINEVHKKLGSIVEEDRKIIQGFIQPVLLKGVWD
jgi:hypothetical protein